MEKRYFVTLSVLLIAIASVSIGYSYVAYTENTNNSADVEYYIITPTSDGTEKIFSGSFTKGVELDTMTAASGITYSLADGTFDTISGHEYSALGKIYLTVDEKQSTDDYRISTTVVDGMGLDTTDYSYYALYQIGSGETASDAKTDAESDTGTLVQLTSVSGDMVASTGTIENQSENNYTVVLTTIYVGMNGGDSLVRPFDTPIGTKVLDAVKFQFAAGIVE